MHSTPSIATNGFMVQAPSLPSARFKLIGAVAIHRLHRLTSLLDKALQHDTDFLAHKNSARRSCLGRALSAAAGDR